MLNLPAMKPLSERTETFTDSVIRRMTRIANACGAINLSQGFPDFDPPEALTRRLAEIAPVGPHQYAITFGAQNFREALSDKQFHFNSLKKYQSWRKSARILPGLKPRFVHAK